MRLPTQEQLLNRPITLMLVGFLLAVASVCLFFFYAAMALGSLSFMTDFYDGAPGWLGEFVLFALTILFYGSWVAGPTGAFLFLFGLVKQLMAIFKKLR